MLQCVQNVGNTTSYAGRKENAVDKTMKITPDLYVPDFEYHVRLVGWGTDYVLLETSACPECQHTVCDGRNDLTEILKERGIKVVIVANDGSCGGGSKRNRLVIRDLDIAKLVFSKPAPRDFAEVWERFSAAKMAWAGGKHPEIVARTEAYLPQLLREIME